LEQINNMNAGEGTEGPAWQRFWQSLDAQDNESATSAEGRSHTPLSMSERQSLDFPSSPPPDVSASELAQFNIGNEVAPGDSVSRMGSRMQGGYLDMDSPFPFKLKSPSGRVHRVNVAPSSGLEFLRQSIVDKFLANEIEALGGVGLVEAGRLVTPGFAVSYVDDEGDIVAITSDNDLADAVRINQAQGFDKGDLFVHHPDTQVDPPPRSSRPRRSVASSSAVDDEHSKSADKGPENATSTAQPEVIPGVPNDLLLPGAIIALAVSIVLVFTFSRSSR
jgi:hypothetical protein